MVSPGLSCLRTKIVPFFSLRASVPSFPPSPLSVSLSCPCFIPHYPGTCTPKFPVIVVHREGPTGSWLWNITSKLLPLLSHFSHVRLCATPETAAHQAPLSLGFSRQEHWRGLPFPSPMHESEKWKWSRPIMSDSLQPIRLLRPWDFPGKSTGVGCRRLLLTSKRGPQI